MKRHDPEGQAYTGFAHRLQATRLEKGLSQWDVARAIGSDQKVVSKWESGQVRPQARKLQALADVLEVTPEYLMKGKRPRRVAPEPEPVAPPDPLHALTPHDLDQASSLLAEVSLASGLSDELALVAARLSAKFRAVANRTARHNLGLSVSSQMLKSFWITAFRATFVLQASWAIKAILLNIQDLTVIISQQVPETDRNQTGTRARMMQIMLPESDASVRWIKVDTETAPGNIQNDTQDRGNYVSL